MMNGDYGKQDVVMDIIYINRWTILCPLYIFSNKMKNDVFFHECGSTGE